MNNSHGVNYWDKCFVILSHRPDNLTDMVQALGRSNRVEFSGDKHGTIYHPEEFNFMAYFELLSAKELEP